MERIFLAPPQSPSLLPSSFRPPSLLLPSCGQRFPRCLPPCVQRFSRCSLSLPPSFLSPPCVQRFSRCPLSLLLPPSLLPASSGFPAALFPPSFLPLSSLRPAVFPLPSFLPPSSLSSSLRAAVFPLPLFLSPPFPPLSPLPSRNNTRCKNEIFHPVRMKYHAHRADIGQTPRQMLKKPSILKKSPKHFALSPKSHYFAGWIRHLKIQTSKTEHRSRQKMPPYIKGGRTIKKDSNLIYSYTPIGQSLPRTGSLLMRPSLRSSPRPAVSPLVPSFSSLPPSACSCVQRFPRWFFLPPSFLRSSPRPAVSPLVLPSSFLPPLIPAPSGFPAGSSFLLPPSITTKSKPLNHIKTIDLWDF